MILDVVGTGDASHDIGYAIQDMIDVNNGYELLKRYTFSAFDYSINKRIVRLPFEKRKKEWGHFFLKDDGALANLLHF